MTNTSEKLEQLAREYDRAFHTVTEADYYGLMERLRKAAQSASVPEDVAFTVRLLRALSADIQEMDERDAAETCTTAADTIEAQAAEIARLKHAAVDACRLGATANFLERAIAAEAERDALAAENAVLRGVLRDAQEKLRLYRDALGGEYLGGVEYTVLEKRITAALSTPNIKAMRMAEELERHRAFVKQQSDASDDFHNNEVALHNAALTEGEKVVNLLR